MYPRVEGDNGGGRVARSGAEREREMEGENELREGERAKRREERNMG